LRVSLPTEHFLDPKLSSRIITAKDGVNAVRTFCEHQGCVFQEIAQQNDIGKDAYVDFGERGIVTPLCAALQIKSGTSYRTSKGDYFIPVDSHADAWRKSTVPVVGVVYDPDDGLIRWIDLTRHLRSNRGLNSGSVPVSRDAILNETSLHGAFRHTLQTYASGGFGGLALNLLSPGVMQGAAVYDAWALGRSDAKFLLILRRLISDLQSEPLRRAIYLLSHAGLHPDIFWTEDNWIPASVAEQVLPTFRWSPEEIVHMISAIDPEDWGRGTLGQCMDVLLYEDPNVVAKLHIAIGLLLRDPDTTQAVRAATLALAHSKDKRLELSLLRRDHQELMNDPWFQEVSLVIEEFGDFSMY
jgi:hypothetical protein